MEPTEPTPARDGYPSEADLAAVRERILSLDPETLDETAVALVQDLETTYEELRVADEELRVQQDQISQLLQGQHLLRWQHERMMAVLPVPVLMTDQSGIIRSVNASAASLVEMRVARMVGKPVLTLLATEDRIDVRRLLTRLAGDGDTFRRVVTVLARNGHRFSAELYVSRLPGPDPQIVWMLLIGAVTERPGSTGGRMVPEALSRLALLPTLVSDDQEALTRAAAICQDCLGPGTALSLAMGPPDEPAALAATSQAAQAFDGAQVVAGEGPCVTAYAEGGLVESMDVRHDPRWPRLSEFAPSAVRGVVAAPLEVGDHLVGALNVYVTGELWPPRLREDTELLAATVAAVLFELGLKKELENLAADMQRALESRATIDQAKGIVMADRRIDAKAAFDHLVRLSSTRHLKLREIAQEIVDRAPYSD